MQLFLIFFMLGWFLYLLTILLGLVHLKNQMSQTIWTTPGMMLWIEMNIKLWHNF